MVRLRGMPRPGPQGRGMGRLRPMPRHIRPEPIPPPFGMPRGRLLRGHPVRPGPPRLPPPRMALPPPGIGLGLPPPLPPRRLPLPPHPPLPPRDLPPPMGRRPLPPPPPPLARRHGMPPPPPIPPMPPLLRRPMRPGPQFVRGRGGVARRGVKRLGATANGRPKRTQKRKEKTEGEFFCEACDRGFKTQELLDSHVAEHQVCGIDGCMFAAHPKIVEKHIQFQHESGLYNRIVFTQNPDDVAKWIAERKSRYPTKENVEKKEAQTSEMIERGERIPMQGKPFHSKVKSGGWQDRRKGRNQNKTNVEGYRKPRVKRVFNTTDEETKWKDPDAWRGNLPKFPGTISFPEVKDEPLVENEEDKHFSDDELNNEQEAEKVATPVVSSVLASLIMNYGSDSDGEDDASVSQIPTASERCNSQSLVSNAELRSLGGSMEIEQSCAGLHSSESQKIKEEVEEDSDGGPEECGIQRKDTNNEPVPKPAKDYSEFQQNKLAASKAPEVTRPARPKPPVRPPMKRYQLSLLEKLLQSEIRHERNAILQCVRYVVRNNFLGCGSST